MAVYCMTPRISNIGKVSVHSHGTGVGAIDIDFSPKIALYVSQQNAKHDKACRDRNLSITHPTRMLSRVLKVTPVSVISISPLLRSTV